MNLEVTRIREQVSPLLLEFVIFAHRDKLSKDGEFIYDPKIHKEPLSIEFEESTMLRYNGMTVTKSGGTYWLRFKSIGELKKTLLSANLPYTFTALLINEKFRNQMYIDEYLNLDKVLFDCFYVPTIKRSIDKEKLDKAIDSLDKILVFKRIKYF